MGRCSNKVVRSKTECCFGSHFVSVCRRDVTVNGRVFFFYVPFSLRACLFMALHFLLQLLVSFVFIIPSSPCSANHLNKFTRQDNLSLRFLLLLYSVNVKFSKYPVLIKWTQLSTISFPLWMLVRFVFSTSLPTSVRVSVKFFNPFSHYEPCSFESCSSIALHNILYVLDLCFSFLNTPSSSCSPFRSQSR